MNCRFVTDSPPTEEETLEQLLFRKFRIEAALKLNERFYTGSEGEKQRQTGQLLDELSEVLHKIREKQAG